MGTLLPLRRKEIANELSSYAVNQPWVTFRCQCFAKSVIYCQTISKTQQVNRKKLVALKVQGETGELQNRVSDHMLLFVENKSYSSYLILS